MKKSFKIFFILVLLVVQATTLSCTAEAIPSDDNELISTDPGKDNPTPPTNPNGD
jgi:hypothetical protein